MPTVTSSGTLSTLVKSYYDKRMLERLTPNLVYQQFGIPKELPKHEGNAVIWHRWTLLSKGRLIAESGAGDARAISAVKVSANLVMVGDHAKITAYLDMVSINSVVEGAVDLFADGAALTLDFITARRLLWKKTSMSATLGCSATTGYLDIKTLSSLLPSNASWTGFKAPTYLADDLTTRNHKLSTLDGGNSVKLLTPAFIRSIKLKLKVAKALPFEDGYFKCILHPDLINQLRGSSAFVDLHKYVETGTAAYREGALVGAQGVGERSLAGVMEGFKFYETTEAPLALNAGTTASTNGCGRMYFTFWFGKGAYGVTNFDGGVNTYVKTPGPQDTSNPLNLYSTVGYRIISAQQILHASACIWTVHGKPTETG